MPDQFPQVHFNDGEGLDEEDLNRAQSLLDGKISQHSLRAGSIGNIHGWGHSLGYAMSGQDPRPTGLDSNALYTPDPSSFVMATLEVSAGGLFSVGWGPQLIVKKAVSAPGTPPTGFAEGGFGGVLAYMLDDDEIGHSAVAAPAANPRWDSIGVILGHATGASESRDQEDAGTRALTTTTPDKDAQRTAASALVSGAESATPTYPAHAAGYSRWMTVLREVGETSLNPDNVRLHAFPMRLKVETVIGADGWFSGTTFEKNGARNGGIQHAAGGVGEIYFHSKQMHAGCRLVGIGISTLNFTNDVDVKIVRMQEIAGVTTPTDILSLGGGSPLGTSIDGFAFAGLPELDDANGNDLPIWGNGRTYGPLLPDGTTPVQARPRDRLAIEISHASDFTATDVINYVQFFYLE